MTEEQKAIFIIKKTEEISLLTNQLNSLIESSSLLDKDTLFNYVDEIFRGSRRIRMIVNNQ